MTDATFSEIEAGIYAYASSPGPTSGLIVGDDAAMVIDGQADPELADDFASRVRTVTDKQVTYALITHYHASRWINLDRFPAASIITTRKCRSSVLHRASFEAKAAAMREPDLYPEPRDVAAPRITLTFKSALTVDLGHRRVECIFFGRGHTAGDAVVWVQDASTMFTGDMIEIGVAPFLGEASFQDWMQALDQIRPYRPSVLAPGRGAPVQGHEDCAEVIALQRTFVDEMWRCGSSAATGVDDVRAVMAALEANASPERRALSLWSSRLPFAASRMMEAVSGRAMPRIWTPARVAALKASM